MPARTSVPRGDWPCHRWCLATRVTPRSNSDPGGSLTRALLRGPLRPPRPLHPPETQSCVGGALNQRRREVCCGHVSCSSSPIRGLLASICGGIRTVFAQYSHSFACVRASVSDGSHCIRKYSQQFTTGVASIHTFLICENPSPCTVCNRRGKSQSAVEVWDATASRAAGRSSVNTVSQG